MVSPELTHGIPKKLYLALSTKVILSWKIVNIAGSEHQLTRPTVLQHEFRRGTHPPSLFNLPRIPENPCSVGYDRNNNGGKTPP